MKPDSDTLPMLSVGAVLFPDFEMLDVFGPLELFMVSNRFVIHTVGVKPGPVNSAGGPEVNIERSMADVADLDVLLVPGGVGTRALVKDAAFLDTLRAIAERSRIETSVCTGSGVLAAAGLLDGLRATTNKGVFDFAVSQGPRTRWERKARWVEDGRVFTSSGVTAGMDMALAVIQRLCDRDTACLAATAAEYLWNEDSAADPFALN